MRILHVPFSYFPSAAGGTEVYVAALCRDLQTLGVESVVAAPGPEESLGTHDGVPMHRFAVQPEPGMAVLHEGRGDAVAAAGFSRILDSVQPDIVHFHAYSPAVSCLCLEAARQHGAKAVFTHHTPTATCLRGDLMRWGCTVCDGELRVGRCSACQLHSLGVPRPAAWAATFLSPLTQFIAGLFPDEVPWQLPLRSTSLVQKRHEVIRRWLAGMDDVVALCRWSRDLLLRIGVKEERLHLVRHGLAHVASRVAKTRERETSKLRLVFMGRLHPTKGLDLVLDALALDTALPVELDLFTLLQGNDTPYTRALTARAQADPRVRFRDPVGPGNVVDTLGAYDALVVPSRWLETGPLVVLEAFAAGLPVIGSDLGGIAEWVEHERNGLLVSGADAASWLAALHRLTGEPELVKRLSAGIAPPRRFADVAAEMAAIYRGCRDAGQLTE